MPTKTIWDLKPMDEVMTSHHGKALFIGFVGDGLECVIATYEEFTRADKTKGRKQINPTIPSSELSLMEG